MSALLLCTLVSDKALAILNEVLMALGRRSRMQAHASSEAAKQHALSGRNAGLAL